MTYNEIALALLRYHTEEQRQGWRTQLWEDPSYCNNGSTVLSYALNLPLPSRCWGNWKDHLHLLPITLLFLEKHHKEKDQLWQDMIEQYAKIGSLLSVDIHEQLIDCAVRHPFYAAKLFLGLKEIGHPFYFHPKLLNTFTTEKPFGRIFFQYYLSQEEGLSDEVHAKVTDLLPYYVKTLMHPFQRSYAQVLHAFHLERCSQTHRDSEALTTLLAQSRFLDAKKNTKNKTELEMVTYIMDRHPEWSSAILRKEEEYHHAYRSLVTLGEYEEKMDDYQRFVETYTLTSSVDEVSLYLG